MTAKALSGTSEVSYSRVTFAKMRLYYSKLIAREISKFTPYFDQLIQFSPQSNDPGTLLENIKCSKKSVAKSNQEFPDLTGEQTKTTAVLVNGNFNHDCDIQDSLDFFKERISRTTRVIAVLYNPYLAFLFGWATKLGIRRGPLPSTFLTVADMENLAELCDYSIVKARPVAYCPFSLFGLGNLINAILPVIPGIRMLSFVNVMVLRPRIASGKQKPSLTVVIPARNEFGNIESAIQRLPDLGCPIEVIFVEGHSKDRTWDEILRVKDLYPNYKISAFQQTGVGKSDAVRLGFEKASCDLLTILDADLTMPPEKLGRFYNAYCLGQADFINGSRLVYPMENEAMRPLNKLGNKFFAKALSFVLGTRLTDSLCGTKLVTRHDYTRMIHWRKDFGDFDPFGDFELLFPASVLGLGIVDIPIAYKNRVYGSTQIRRFYHGLMLLRMVWVGFYKIALGRL